MSEKLDVCVDRMREASAFIATKADDTADGVKHIDRIVSGDLLGHGRQGRAAMSYENYWRDWIVDISAAVRRVRQLAPATQGTDSSCREKGTRHDES
ncbi:hypothetical protein [Rhodococcus sp. ARC_M6]|uniref:hypothetical protein n=1 Tax=Rhodococcus sp. ARC_M6 TaxID=2928852 RepID=UPI001FB4DB91|nr:hypothetical protein [Rhodococcus sp. ARC_M6]MCJ0904405.1 hypothetical protein [Rhodococcus sp. ARC_M6]